MTEGTWRDVVDRANHLLAAVLRRVTSPAKVADFDLSAVIQVDILKLNVAMNAHTTNKKSLEIGSRPTTMRRMRTCACS